MTQITCKFPRRRRPPATAGLAVRQRAPARDTAKPRLLNACFGTRRQGPDHVQVVVQHHPRIHPKGSLGFYFSYGVLQ